MPTKPLSIISLVLFVPVALLTMFAVRSLSLETEALNARSDRLAQHRMVSAGEQFNASLEAMGRAALAQTIEAYERDGPKALTRGARKRQYIYAFVFKEGTTIHSAAALEHQYELARGLQDGAQTLAGSLNSAKPTATSLMTAGGVFSLLTCKEIDTGEDVCIALENSEVIRNLRSTLDFLERGTGLTHVTLVAPNKAKVGDDETEKESRSAIPLEGLLHDWKLYSETPTPDNLTQNTLSLYVIGSLLIAGWALMTWMLHRSAVLKQDAAAVRAGIVAQLAHELRTPLANLRLHTELLSRKADDAAAVQRYSGILKSEIERLSSVAENAIVVARGAMAERKLDTAVPDDCLKDVLARYDPTLSNAGCQVRVRPAAGIACSFDRTSWERCIVNLIDNARKYAPGTEIEISTAQNANILRLAVSDGGRGITADRRERIFEPLERGGATHASGFGLGLAAVRALARQNGGDCWVEDANPGARFVLTIAASPVNDQVPIATC